MPRLLTPVFFLALGLLAAVPLGATRDRADAVDGIRFVEIGRCWEHIPDYADRREEIDRQSGELGGQLQAELLSIQEAEGELALLDPSSEEYLMRSFELENRRKALAERKDFFEQWVRRQKLQLVVDGYRTVNAAVEQLGREKGYGGILVVPTGLDELPTDPMAAFESLQLRSILWTHPAFDVTDEVIALLQGS